MAESFIIFFVLAGIIVGGLLLIFLYFIFEDLIWGIILFLLGFTLIVGGIALLVKLGGGPGALGIFLALTGAALAWLGVLNIKDFKKYG